LAGGAECATYDPITHAFQALLRTSRSVSPGAYDIQVNVTIDGTLAASGSRTVQITAS
jgi:hypothetical protein